MANRERLARHRRHAARVTRRERVVRTPDDDADDAKKCLRSRPKVFTLLWPGYDSGVQTWKDNKDGEGNENGEEVDQEESDFETQEEVAASTVHPPCR
jgi:hypothetical protein